MNAEHEPQPQAGPADPTLPAAEYILVALDLSPHSQAALAAAAELAAALLLELDGLYVEDMDLLRLCGLPFGIEFGTFTASPRRMVQTHLEREFRMQATQLRKIMADVAGQRRVPWAFQGVRGGVAGPVLAGSAAAQTLRLGRFRRWACERGPRHSTLGIRRSLRMRSNREEANRSMARCPSSASVTVRSMSSRKPRSM